MNIEPLKNLLQIYNDNNKSEVLLYYLPKITTSYLSGYEFINNMNDLFLNDRLIFISKSTGLLFNKGIIIKIISDKITIQTKYNNISLDPNLYYIFIKPRKNKLKKVNHKYFKELLRSLGN